MLKQCKKCLTMKHIKKDICARCLKITSQVSYGDVIRNGTRKEIKAMAEVEIGLWEDFIKDIKAMSDDELLKYKLGLK